MNDEEIRRDLPLLYEKISRCERTIVDLERSSMKEEMLMKDLQSFINIDQQRISKNKKPRFDLESMKSNIERHQNNILLFSSTIETEKKTIEKFKKIISILEEDLRKQPEKFYLEARR